MLLNIALTFFTLVLSLPGKTNFSSLFNKKYRISYTPGTMKIEIIVLLYIVQFVEFSVEFSVEFIMG